MPLDSRKVKRLAESAIEEFIEVAKVLTTDIPESFVRRLSGVGSQIQNKGRSHKQDVGVLPDGLTETQILTPDSVTTPEEATTELETPGTPENCEAMLMDGLQEVTGLLMEGCSVSEIFNVALESMYRSMGFNRVVLALLNQN